METLSNFNEATFFIVKNLVKKISSSRFTALHGEACSVSFAHQRKKERGGE